MDQLCNMKSNSGWRPEFRSEVALQAATSHAAKLLRADDRIGTIEKGKEATLLVVDGNPLQDVRALSSISNVFLKGERVQRSTLFEQK